MTKFYLVIVFYIHLESIVFLLMYNFQDSIGPDNVFYAVHTLYAVFDLIIVVCVVFVALTGDLFHFSGCSMISLHGAIRFQILELV